MESGGSASRSRNRAPARAEALGGSETIAAATPLSRERSGGGGRGGVIALEVGEVALLRRDAILEVVDAAKQVRRRLGRELGARAQRLERLAPELAGDVVERPAQPRDLVPHHPLVVGPTQPLLHLARGAAQETKGLVEHPLRVVGGRRGHGRFSAAMVPRRGSTPDRGLPRGGARPARLEAGALG